VLKDVARGDTDTSPALEDLIATGLVARHADGLTVTEAGHTALKASEPDRLERIAYWLFAVGIVTLAALELIDWLS
jgi:hypothetical protein